MATFQSQINILAAGQHNLHKKIEEITDFSLFVKYDSLNMEISDNKDSNRILIQDLGSLAYDGILKVVDSTTICLMDNNGIYNCLTSNSNVDFSGLSTTQACSLTLSTAKNSLNIQDNYSTYNYAQIIYEPELSITDGLDVTNKIYKFINTAYKDIRDKDNYNTAKEEGHGADDNEDPEPPSQG